MEKICIVINRQYASGGREVARILSERLNIPFYGYITFCLIHQVPVAGERLPEDQTKREGLPGRSIRPLWDRNMFLIQKRKILHT